jgi:hypothetical protein
MRGRRKIKLSPDRIGHTSSLKAHFDGQSIVLDEPPPATLTVGQAVRVIVETSSDKEIADMTDDELAEWLEVETHKLRGVPYNHHIRDGR